MIIGTTRASSYLITNIFSDKTKNRERGRRERGKTRKRTKMDGWDLPATSTTKASIIQVHVVTEEEKK